MASSVRRIFKNRLLEKEECHDVLVLAVLWLAQLLNQKRSRHDVSPTLDSFKEAWKTLKFSHMYSAKPKNITFEAFMQMLYNVCLRTPCMVLEEGDLHILIQELNEKKLVDFDDMKELEQAWNRLRDVAALYGLFCIFEAQPRNTRVLIRVQEQLFSGFRALSRLVDHGPGDARSAFSKMWTTNAFCFGVSFFKVSSSLGNKYHPGAGSISLTAGLDPIDAVTLRESRYHLDSTLRGLGTQFVESLCLQYRNALSNVMMDKKLDDTPESYNLKGIADLNFGYEIHRNVLLAADKIRFSLYGKEFSNKTRKAGKNIGIKKPKPRMTKSLAGANAVLEREQARARDIKQKRKCMERNIGLLDRHEEEAVRSSSDDDSDMPDLWDGLLLPPELCLDSE